MKLKIFFDGWILGEGVYLHSKEVLEATLGSFHYGTVFTVDLHLRDDEILDLKKQMAKGLQPKFIGMLENRN